MANQFVSPPTVELLEAREVLSTFYVSTVGVDGAAGSSVKSAWRTLQYAVDNVKAGDTILVESGSYVGCRIGDSGSAGANITLAADVGARVTVSSRGPSNRHGSVIELENFNGPVTNWVINGLEVTGGLNYGIDLRDTNSITVENCNVHDNHATGIFTAFSNYITIENNESSYNGEHGIYDSNSGSYATITGNVIHDNRDCGIEFNADGSQGGSGISTGDLIADNVIHDNGVGGGAAINLDGVQHSTIENNLLYNNHATGIVLYQLDANAGSFDDVVADNTVVMPAGARWVVSISNNSTGDTLVDNIFVNNNPSNGAVSITPDSEAGFVSDYNVVSNSFTTTGGSSKLSLTQWRSAMGQDEHSQVVAFSSLFENAAVNDYHLAAGSQAVGAGTATDAAATDLDGNTRPSSHGYDVGAYEYTGSVWSPKSASSQAATDVVTQGNWKGIYGSDGYAVAGSSVSVPSYASTELTGGTGFVWAGSTSDVRALQQPSGSGRVAATWYSASSLTLDLDLTDGQTHQVALYLLDWDRTGRSERVDVLDADTGVTLSSETVSSFASGEYVVFNVSGDVEFKITDLAGPNAVVSGIFFEPATATNTSASFVKTDAATGGYWKPTYGADGYSVAGDATSLPSYASVSLSGESPFVWAASTGDARALVKAAAIDRVAACWYAPNSFNVDVNLTDGQTHQVALYLLDWDGLNRNETVSVVNGATGAVLTSETSGSFVGGEYLVFDVSGHVDFRITRVTGANAVLGGIFFGGAPGSTASASAAFVKTDTTTKGNWVGSYGSAGYASAGMTTSLPADGSAALTGDQAWTWAASTSDSRALEQAGGVGRTAATWYSPTSFTLDVDFTDGQTHQIALYLLDYDRAGRSERVDVLSAATGAVLASDTASNFGNGEYLVFNVTGDVAIKFTSLSGPNAVLSGLFFG